MPSKTSLDPAVLRSLNPFLPPSITPSVSTHGGSGFSSTYSITAPPKKFFMKTSSSPGSETMFHGEHASLNAIHDAVPSLCPRSYGFGNLEDGKGYFLVTDFLNMSSGFGSRSSTTSGKGTGMSLAEKMGKLHSTPAATPEGYEKPMFGFPVTTCCGDTPQDNTWSEDWAEFYGERRLMSILQRGESRNGKDGDLRKNVEQTVQVVVPRLLRKGHLGGKEGIRPVVVHGDLWSGNKGVATVELEDGSEATEQMVFDPSAVYGHSEFEFGIANMFGGFGGSFFKEYHEIVPKTEPVEEYEDRMNLYELYHHLNHWAIFGGGYRSGAMGIMKGLIRKYDDTK